MGLNQSKPNKANQSPSKPVTFTLTPLGRFPHQSDIWQQLQAAEQHGTGLPLPTDNTPPLLQHQQAQIVPPSSSNSNFFMNPLASPEVYSIGSIHQTPMGGGGYSPIQPDLGNAKTKYEPPNVQIDGSAGTSPQYRAGPVSDKRPKESPLLCDTNPDVDNAKTKYESPKPNYGAEHPISDKPTKESPLLCDTNPNVDNAKTKYEPSNPMHQQNAPLYLPISGSVDGFGSPPQYGIEHFVADKSTNGSPSLCDTNPNVDNAKTKYEPPNVQIDGSAGTSPPQYRASPVSDERPKESPLLCDTNPDVDNAKTKYEPPNVQIDGSAGTSPPQYRASPVSDERPKESPLLCDTNPDLDNAKTKYEPPKPNYGIEHPVADKSTNGSPLLCDINPNVDNAKTKYEPPKPKYQIGKSQNAF